MHCLKKITNDLLWMGANDRRLAMFEGIYHVPKGVSYNSYLLIDEKTVLFDTVDKAVAKRFVENLTEALKDRTLDYLIVQHMEPDHSAVIMELLDMYPDMVVVCNARTLEFIKQFHGVSIDSRAYVVKEGDALNSGKHEFRFYMAPMVHWPEVMVTYDTTDKILFSADAFGCFGALNGAMFADEVDFSKDYMDEARRYYANIVGKYGTQTKLLLEKALTLEITMICPLHGFVWRNNIQEIISKYIFWSAYTPEEYGVMIAYASVYGNTENAAEILSCKLRDKGIKTVMFDVSVTHSSEIVAAAFKWSHLVFASTTYNAGIFVSMEALINDLASHNLQNRTVAIIENGSWAAASGALIQNVLKKRENIQLLNDIITIKSSLKKEQLAEIDRMSDAISESISLFLKHTNDVTPDEIAVSDNIDLNSLFKISYGLFILSARDGNKDNGCIINTAMQITDKPLRIVIAVNKSNLTGRMIINTGVFNLSVLTQTVPFDLIKHFGFCSGYDTDKFVNYDNNMRTKNGVHYINKYVNSVISATTVEMIECETHTLFIADITQAFSISDEPSVTYQYYFDNIKLKPQIPKEIKKGFICKICSYVYEGEILPDDYICPLCKHGAKDFEPI